MRLARYDDNRLGLVEGDRLRDVTSVLGELPSFRWPLPLGDQLVAALPRLRDKILAAAKSASARPVAGAKLLSPVANPGKILGAPINYNDHIEESNRDPAIAYGRTIRHIGEFGLFQKAVSSLVGPSEGVALRFLEKRNDHEMELAAVIGKPGTRISETRALDHVAGYCIGLDMTVRGPEVPTFRKSIDTYAVLGPWLVTADEVADPNNLDFWLKVNGETRQESNTRFLVYNVQKLIAWASEYYTLHPGDVIMTGTPRGVGPVAPGDVMDCEIVGIGRMQVAVRQA